MDIVTFTCLRVVRIEKVWHIKHLAQPLAHSQCLINVSYYHLALNSESRLVRKSFCGLEWKSFVPQGDLVSARVRSEMLPMGGGAIAGCLPMQCGTLAGHLWSR